MWANDYIGSLNVLPGALAELGATVGLDRVSLEEEEEEEEKGKLDLTRAVDFVTVLLSVLDSLEDDDYFLFLNNLSKIEKELRSILVLAQQWKVPEITDEVVHALIPVHSTVCRFAPRKALGIFLNMKDFLEGIGGYGWDGEDCLEHMTVLQEDLEELQPGSCLKCLVELRQLLVVHDQCLVRLAYHPFFQRELGRQNLFHRLISIRQDLEVALRHEDLLVEMQHIFEELNQLQVIDLQVIDLQE